MTLSMGSEDLRKEPLRGHSAWSGLLKHKREVNDTTGHRCMVMHLDTCSCSGKENGIKAEMCSILR